MGFLNWKYTASDLADWFDEQDDKYWREHDEWLIQSQRLGDASPVLVFAAWYNDRLSTIGERTQHMLAGGVVDVLRLGNDFDFSSGWGVAKGTVLNVLRLATVIEPASEAVQAGGRYAGILATADLSKIKGATGPCAYVSANNVLSYLRGKTVQLFATVEDIVAVKGGNEGINPKTLFATPEVQSALAKFGITFETRTGLTSIDDVLRAAKATDGPITFGVEWPKPNGQTARHMFTAVKDAAGEVKILDYVPQGEKGVFQGFRSIAEIREARTGWPGFEQVVLSKAAPIYAFSSRYLRLLSFADGSFSIGVPVAMGVKWLRGATKEDKIFDMARSVWRFVKSRKSTLAPPPKQPSVLPDIPDTLPSIPSVPDQNGKRLGVAPLPPEAGNAPRIDWLTGVQYRLKYLNYYKGSVSGLNDKQTKNAVLAFQKDWFDDKSQWDAIPGPLTQGAIYAALGW